ncbi:uncharacterized protein LOC125713255 isoform X1 [Brienomyrus brachyistius]|uniref:uncharacterized protein LOC125713255 isoform X1 n=1 Tax=Brienomyrus brachyistius TaxID=42636 RepID=UPI0020B43744|nr:uncharacterized protein LOC125713255 isoform X1 [Brienomyrus brachyistius]
MASMPGVPTSSITKVLLLGAIAAASAFVVTILIVLLCMGCQRKRRRRKLQADGERYSLVNAQGALRQSKLRSFSKSDTRLHEMSRLTCNGGGTTKHRPASMDLLYMSSRRSNTDLRLIHPRQLPKAPSGGVDDREHTYSEVGRRASPLRVLDDGLYESVGGMAGEPEGQRPAHRLGGDPGPPGMAAAPQDPVMAEYASIRKVRKADRSPRREGGARSQHALPPPHTRSHEAPRKNTDPFLIHSFHKETVFMGNGEEYIWKPPEEDDMAVPQRHLAASTVSPPAESDREHSLEISEMYSKVCKPNKKKWAQTSPPDTEESNGQRNRPWSSGGEEGEMGHCTANSQDWVGGGGGGGVGHEEGGGEECNVTDSRYESVGEKTWPQEGEETEPAYETIDGNWKGDGPNGATARSKKRSPQKQKQPSNQAAPGEHFYESISDVRQGLNTSSTTTIFTFNDGMEMYVTGL